MARISDAITQPFHLTSEGPFQAARSKVRNGQRAPAAPSVQRTRSANAADLDLAGAESEELLIFWKAMGWAGRS
jgi:hypothetical protein